MVPRSNTLLKNDVCLIVGLSNSEKWWHFRTQVLRDSYPRKKYRSRQNVVTLDSIALIAFTTVHWDFALTHSRML